MRAEWYSAVPAGSWGMLGNGLDNTVAPGYPGCGDCTCAGAAHMIDQVAWYAQGNTPAPINANEVIAMYSAITGYDVNTGQTTTAPCCRTCSAGGSETGSAATR